MPASVSSMRNTNMLIQCICTDILVIPSVQIHCISMFVFYMLPTKAVLCAFFFISVFN